MYSVMNKTTGIMCIAGISLLLTSSTVFAGGQNLSVYGQNVYNAINQTDWQNEKYDFGDLSQNFYIQEINRGSDVLEVFPFLDTGGLTGSTEAYKNAFTYLAATAGTNYLEWEVLNLHENCDFILNVYTDREEVRRFFDRGILSDSEFKLLDGLGILYDVNGELFETVMLSKLGDSTYDAIRELACMYYFDPLLQGGAGQVIEELNNDYSDRFLLFCMDQGIDAFWDNCFPVYSFAAEAANNYIIDSMCVENIKVLASLSDIQSAFKKMADVIEVYDFANEDDYLYTYRNLVVSYLQTGISMTQLVYDEGMIGEETYNRALLNLQTKVYEVQMAGNEYNPLLSETEQSTTDERTFADTPAVLGYCAFPSGLSVGDTFKTWGSVSTPDGSSIGVLAVSITNTDTGETADYAESGHIEESYSNLSILDNELYYNYLPAGNYCIRVWDDGTMIGENYFSVYQEDGLFTSHDYHLPGAIAMGNVFSIDGSVRGWNSLDYVRVSIDDPDGNIIFGGSYTAGSNVFNLGNADADLLFNQLERGIYYYTVSAADNAGNQETLIHQPFYVY